MSQVLEKAFRLIDLVAAGHDTLAGLTQAADLSRSTAHRLLSTLVEHNYLSLAGKNYRLGYRLLELGETKKRSLTFLDVLRPILMRYAEETGDTIHLAVLDGFDIVLIDRIFGDRQLRINSYPGLRNAAFKTAVGKVLIAHLPPKQWKAYVGRIPPDYRLSEEQIIADIARARRTDMATDVDECNIGTCGIASSFTIGDGLRIACSINGATVYFGDGRLERLAPTVRRLAEELRTAVNT